MIIGVPWRVIETLRFTTTPGATGRLVVNDGSIVRYEPDGGFVPLVADQWALPLRARESASAMPSGRTLLDWARDYDVFAVWSTRAWRLRIYLRGRASLEIVPLDVEDPATLPWRASARSRPRTRR